MYSRYNAIENRNRENLKGKKAVVIGLGATGSVIAEHLARHGVEVCLIDRDYLEMKDLYTSNIYSKEQCQKAMPKAIAAENKLKELTNVNGKIKNIKHYSDIPESDIIMDGSDNVETRKIIDRAAEKRNIPWVFSSALAEKGFSMFIRDACFNCMIKNLKPRDSCEQHGVLREISSITASFSSMKAINYLSGEQIDEKLELVPSMQSFEPLKCNCSEQEQFEARNICGDNKYQVFGDANRKNLKGEVIVQNKYLTRVNFNGSEITLFTSGRAIVHAEHQEAAEELYREATAI